VLRLPAQAPLTYTDGAGTVGRGSLSGTTVIRGEERLTPAPRLDLTLAVAPPGERERLRFLIEKSAELGVRRLLWVKARYGQTSLPSPDRARSWAVGGLEQSRGAHLMEVGSGWQDLAELDPDQVWWAHPGGASFPDPRPGRMTIVIGPEGGWAPEELPPPARWLGLGDSVLRVETAALAAAALATRC
jgi:16S rRNA (uracil1498-N3)-methyltransferase